MFGRIEGTAVVGAVGGDDGAQAADEQSEEEHAEQSDEPQAEQSSGRTGVGSSSVSTLVLKTVVVTQAVPTPGSSPLPEPLPLHKKSTTLYSRRSSAPDPISETELQFLFKSIDALSLRTPEIPVVSLKGYL